MLKRPHAPVYADILGLRATWTDPSKALSPHGLRNIGPTCAVLFVSRLSSVAERVPLISNILHCAR